jgi:hypothetical protein
VKVLLLINAVVIILCGYSVVMSKLARETSLTALSTVRVEVDSSVHLNQAVDMKRNKEGAFYFLKAKKP